VTVVPVLALVTGCALAAMSSGRWQVSLAAWLAPAFLLLFSRTQEPAVALVGVYLALFLAAAVANRGVMPLTGLAYGLSTAIQAAFGVLPFALDRLISPDLPGFAATLLFPAAWTAIEFGTSRSNPFGTWGSVAYTQAGNLPLMQLASVTGIWGIVFVTTWFGSLVSWAAIVGPMAPGVLAGAAVFAAIIGLLMLGGSIRLLRGEIDVSAIRVAAIEPTGQRVDQGQLMAMLATAQSPTGDRGDLRRSFTALHDLLLATSEREMTAGATVIVWPEAAAPVLAEDEAALLERGRAQARAHGAYLLMGIVTLHAGPPFRLENKAILIEPSGDQAFTYRKARPVPGWEAQVSLAGDGQIPVLATPSGRLAAAICFDLDFPGLLRQAGVGHADLLLAPASDWPEIGRIHHAMASFRAVENGFSLVRAARWGVSGVVDPYGRTLSITDHRSPGADAAVAFVRGDGLSTVYARIGDAFAWSCVATTGAAVAWALLGAVGAI
jgi:apolipoprotein N-acyltransferase